MALGPNASALVALIGDRRTECGHKECTYSASVPDAAQIIEPQKPDSASAGPDAQKTAIAGKVLEQEFIERQQ